MRQSLLICAAILVLAGMIGCSGSGGNPIAPAPDSPDQEAPPDLTATAEQPSEPLEATSGHALLGYWDVAIDPGTGKVEFVPRRSTSLHLNMVPVLEGVTMNLSLESPLQVIDGVLHVDIGLNHPFPGRITVSGFDVKGILITEGSEIGFADPDIRIAGPHETRLVNADGFTRWWNPGEFLHKDWTGYVPGKLGSDLDPASWAILSGYKLFADDLDADTSLSELDTAGRALFTAGELNIRHYAISLAAGLRFNYAVDCSWAVPDPRPPVNLPDDFPPEANQSEPWFIEVTETNNTLWYEAGDHGGNVFYDVAVHDWQGVGDLGDLTIESPGLFSMTASEPLTTSEFTAYYYFEFVLPPLASADPIDVLITAEVPGDYDSFLTGVDKPLRGYHRHITEVSDEDPIFNIPPVAIIEATTSTEIMVGESVSFDATASYDPDGYIDEYTWDFNGDSIFTDSYDGDPETPTHTFTESGVFQVRARVRDNMLSSDTSDPVAVRVTLEPNDPPIAVAEATTPTDILEDETVSFDGTGSHDLDGVVVDWKWDFDGDGNYDDPYEGDMQTPTATFPDPGTFYVDLKVIDDEDGWGVLEVKITVNVEDIPNVPPIACSVSTTPTEIVLCGCVTFDASDSDDPDGMIVAYDWDFDGDGTYGDAYDSGTDINPTKCYYEEGVFNVDLRVTDDEGDWDTLDEPIVVTVTNVPPTADAISTTPTEIYGADSVTFDASGSTDPDCDDIVLYEWDFGGDGVFGDAYDSGTDVNPTKTYFAQGEYGVRLRVTDGAGGTDDTDDPIIVTVTNRPPTACGEITSDWPYARLTDIFFSGECSEDLDGTIVSWEWDLNADESYEQSGETVSFNFDTAGDYVMQLKVTDNESDWDLLDEPLSFRIYDEDHMPPVISEVSHSRTTSERGNMSESVQLGVDFTDAAPPGDTHTFLWTCPYGSFDDETIQTPIWYPPNEVVKCDITVRVTDSDGFWHEGACQQWVTKWAVKTNNPNADDGCMVIPYSMDTVYDGYIDPADYPFPTVQPNGNVIYMNFWATWCPPCEAELPELTEIYQMYEGEDYIHLMIDVNETKAEVEDWLSDYDYEATYWALDPNFYFWRCNNWNGDSNGIPQHLIFDRDGRCRAGRVGSISSTYDLTKYIDELI